MRTFDAPFDIDFWRSQPRITSTPMFISNFLDTGVSGITTYSAPDIKIKEYQARADGGRLRCTYTAGLKTWFASYRQRYPSFAIQHVAIDPADPDNEAVWYTPAYFFNDSFEISDDETEIVFFGDVLPATQATGINLTDNFQDMFDLMRADPFPTVWGLEAEFAASQEWYTWQFEETGTFDIYDLRTLHQILARKYLVNLFPLSFDGTNRRILFQNRHVTFSDFEHLGRYKRINSQNIMPIRVTWVDENDTIYENTSEEWRANHFLGFVPSSADTTEINGTIQNPTFELSEYFDPRLENGDALRITVVGGTLQGIVEVTETFKIGEGLKTTIRADIMPRGISSGAGSYGVAGAGGASAMRIVVDTTTFDGALGPTDNTLQKALETLDDTGGGEITGTLALTGDITPSTISSTQNDYNPTGLDTATVLRLSTSGANRSITGLAGGADGRIVIIHNVGSTYNIVLLDEDSGSSAANRFDLGGYGVAIVPGAAVVLQYDSTSERWRALNVTAASLQGAAITTELLAGLDDGDTLIWDAESGFFDSGPFPSSGTPTDGWIADTDTWTRTGNHTFTVSGDVTTRFRKGTKIRYKDGGSYEYGVVIASSHSGGTTTVTLCVNTDYTMAAATITDKYYSYIQNPEGYPDWFAWTPTTTGFSGTPTTLAFVKVDEDTVYLHILVDGTSNATGFTITNNPVPSNLGTNPVAILGLTRDNGVIQTTPGRAVLTDASATITFRKDTANANWTNSGTKTGQTFILYKY